jgi:hypothetical protein
MLDIAPVHAPNLMMSDIAMANGDSARCRIVTELGCKLDD